MFNSLLILMPVIAAQILGAAFSGATFSDAPTVEAIDQTRHNMDESFAAMAPRNADDKYKFWQDIVSRELTARDVTAARGFLLTAPQMLSREEVKELMAAADAEVTGTEDERIALAALSKKPRLSNQRRKTWRRSRPKTQPLRTSPPLWPKPSSPCSAPMPIWPTIPNAGSKATAWMKWS